MKTMAQYLQAVDSSTVAIATAVIITTLSILWLTRSRRQNQSPPLPPGPKGLPIVGYLPFLGSGADMLKRLSKLVDRYGPIYKLYFGQKLFIVIDSPDLLKEMACDHGTIFENRASTVALDIITYSRNDMAWAPYGSQWRDLRKLFTQEMMSSASMKASYNLRKELVRKAVNDVYASCRSGGGGNPIIQFRDLALNIQMNVVVNMICGGNILAQKRDEIAAALIPVTSQVANLIIKPNVSDFFPALATLDVQGIGKQAKALFHRFDKILSDLITDRINNPVKHSEVREGRTDFLQILLDFKQKPENKWLSITQVKGLLVNIFVGGTDTTAAATEWVISYLLKNPHVMEKVKRELDEVVGLNGVVEESHIANLVYLDSVVKETLRFQPVSSFIMRKPTDTCVVGGYTVPKDSTVYINIWSRHKDPMFWANPSEFRPERFLDDKEKWNYFGNNNFSFIPFGTGRRICPGISLSDRMVKYMLASFLHSFDWQIPSGEVLDMSDQLLTTLTKRIPLRVVAVPRLSRPEQYQQ